MSVRAEWRLAELLTGEANPFDKVILSTGLTVDLTGSEEEVHAGLKRSLELESRLFNKGIICELKDNGQDCLSCPEYVADRMEEPRAPLCRLGRDQRVMEERVKQLTTNREGVLLDLVSVAEECSELGHVDPEYAELLSAVGL